MTNGSHRRAKIRVSTGVQTHEENSRAECFFASCYASQDTSSRES